MADPRTPLRHRVFASRGVSAAIGRLGYGIVKIMAALPSRWILKIADVAGHTLSVIDRRAWKIAHANIRSVLGEALHPHEVKRIHRESYTQATRAIGLMLHLQPMTAERFAKWVDVPEKAGSGETVDAIRERGGVLVSGHIGNWELLLGMRQMFPQFPRAVFLTEPNTHPAINQFLEQLRSHVDLINVFRKGGAVAVARAVRKGGVAALLVDRNIRKKYGGVYVPFCGLPSRTTPLPAWIAVHTKVPLVPLFCFPKPNGRYRIWMGPDLNHNLVAATPSEQVTELTRRINDVLEDVIRAQPELWNWRLKRFKSRPHPELKTYPAYSSFDPRDEAIRTN